MPFPELDPRLAQALGDRGYAEPTPVQAAVLSPELASRDLLVSAQTGSGKTLAFGLAMAPAVLDPGGEPVARPRALVVAPTRELALQVQRELEWLYAPAGARVIACVGGMEIRREARLLAQGPAIVVGTPGRLRDHLERGRFEPEALKAVVLDEADEMLDLGFREDLEFILEATPADRRTLLFSATLPREIVTLAGFALAGDVKPPFWSPNDVSARSETPTNLSPPPGRFPRQRSGNRPARFVGGSQQLSPSSPPGGREVRSQL